MPVGFQGEEEGRPGNVSNLLLVAIPDENIDEEKLVRPQLQHGLMYDGCFSKVLKLKSLIYEHAW